MSFITEITNSTQKLASNPGGKLCIILNFIKIENPKFLTFITEVTKLLYN